MLINNLKPQNIITPKSLPSFKGDNSNNNPFDESLTRSFVSTGFLQGYNEIKGMAGKSDVKLKETEIRNSEKRSLHYEGKIGSNPTEITINGTEITGTVGKKQLELTFEKNNLNQFYMRGFVGDEFIDFADGSSVAEIGEDKDTAITLLSLFGCKLNIKDDKIAGIGFSKQAKEDKTRQTFSDWQIVQQNQILAQDIDMRDRVSKIMTDLYGEENSPEEELKTPDETTDIED